MPLVHKVGVVCERVQFANGIDPGSVSEFDVDGVVVWLEYVAEAVEVGSQVVLSNASTMT